MKLIVDLTNPEDRRSALQLLGGYPEGAPTETPGGAVGFAEELWRRLGTNLRLLTIAAVSFDDYFNLLDLAERVGAVAKVLDHELSHEPTLQRVKGQWNAKLLPTANRVRDVVPDAPSFKNDAKRPVDGALWQFSITPAVRDAIRRQDLAAEYFARSSA